LQLELPNFAEADAIDIAVPDDAEGRGAVFTKPEVADFILNLCGYTPASPLHELRLLEPGCGNGDFLVPAVARLLNVARRGNVPVERLADAIRGVELHAVSLDVTRDRLDTLLDEHDVDSSTRRRLLDAWLACGDYLLLDDTRLGGPFTHVVGNPPYVRQERVDPRLMDLYRRRYRTIYDRADLYVPFFERSLRLLGEGGRLGFICADRWHKNRYGSRLREMVSRDYHLDAYVDMTGVPAFAGDVIAYPAITIIRAGSGEATACAYRPPVERPLLDRLATSMLNGCKPVGSVDVTRVKNVARGDSPWLLQNPMRLALLRGLEERLPTLEEAGCRVGIGVATGADKAFIGDFEAMDVEPERKLPLVTTRDIAGGTVKWGGKGVLNPFGSDGKVVPLAEWPRFARYVEARREAISGRNVAKRNPHRWYRTIDRIDPDLAGRPKLLIPDIKGEPHVVHEPGGDGGLYPHHNLYYVVSDEWPLEALQRVLASSVTALFIGAYSTEMRGGYVRFQAQYLRRIRIPRWRDVPAKLRRELTRPDVGDAVVARLYGVGEDELTAAKGAA
jgi:hypothetical protein